MADTERFMTFYGTSAEHLAEEIGRWNARYGTDTHPILAPRFADFADLMSGGKLLRGVFVHLGYALAKAERTAGAGELMPVHERAYADGLALAFEIFQTAVLIHDDVIDHARLRRGKKTAHVRYAEEIGKRALKDHAGDTPASAALCLGDAGLYLANRIIAETYRDDPRLAELILYFDDVVIDTIRGEMLDVLLPCESTDPAFGEGDPASLLSASVTEIYRMKTARYSVQGPLHLGMLAGGASDALMEAADRFAMAAGTAFQIKDDILGIYAEEEGLGKDVGGDIAEAKLTILYEYVAGNKKEVLPALLSVYGKDPVTAENVRRVQDIFRESGALLYAEDAMEKCFAEAEKAISSMPLPDEAKETLYGLIIYFRERKK